MLPLPFASTCVTLLDLTVPPVLSLPGAVCKLDALTDGLFDMSLQAPCRLHDSVFPFTAPGAVSHSSSLTCTSRAPGQILVYCHPCLRKPHRCNLVAEPDRTPRPDATWLGLTVACDNPDAPQSCAQSPARLPTGCPLDYSSLLSCSDHRTASFSSVETLRHAFWPARFPCLCLRLPIPGTTSSADATAPPSLSLLGAVEAHAFERPDVLALTSGPSALLPGCRSALTDRSCSSQLLVSPCDCLFCLS
jgi:hypothetical protein